MDAMSDLAMDDMMVTRLEDASGSDIDLMGDGVERPKMLMPDPGSGEKDCPAKEPDGSCPPGCDRCVSFLLELENSSRARRMEED